MGPAATLGGDATGAGEFGRYGNADSSHGESRGESLSIRARHTVELVWLYQSRVRASDGGELVSWIVSWLVGYW